MKPHDTGHDKTKKKQGLGPLPDDARSLGQPPSQARIPWGRAPVVGASSGRSWGRRRDGGEDRLGKVQGGLTLPPVNSTINQNQPGGCSSSSSASVSSFTSSWGTPQHPTHELVIPEPTKKPTPPKAYYGGGASVSTASTQSMTDASGSVSTGTSNRSRSSGMGPPLSVPTRGSSSPGAHDTTAATAPTAFGFSQRESQTSHFTAPTSVNCGASVQTDFSSVGVGSATHHPYYHHGPSPSLATHDEYMLPNSTGTASFPVAAPAPPIPAASPSPALDLSVEKANAERARFKQTGVPKAAVHSWYGQKPRRQIISQENYITWHDDGPPHLMHYTSLFICPMTGEAFGSGRYGDEKHYKTDTTNPGVVWYKRKALAEHGAAARAFDCLVFREAHATPGVTPTIHQIGDDEPYLAAKSMSGSNSGSSSSMKDDSAAGAVPGHVPPNVQPKVEAAIRKGKAFKMQGIPEVHATSANQDDDGNVEEAGWNKNPAERQQDFEMQQQQKQQHQQKRFGSLEHSIFGDPS